MLKLFIPIVIILALAFLLLGIKTLIKKNGTFPSGHIGDNEALKKKGISCAKSQDREERQ